MMCEKKSYLSKGILATVFWCSPTRMHRSLGPSALSRNFLSLSLMALASEACVHWVFCSAISTEASSVVLEARASDTGGNRTLSGPQSITILADSAPPMVTGTFPREDFIAFRTERDKQLKVPALIIPSLQVNMRGGEVPEDDAGNMMLKTPINRL